MAWELINEPEEAVERYGIVKSDMEAFLREGCQAIRNANANAGFKTSVGFKYFSSLEDYRLTDLVSLPQYHYYPERKALALEEKKGACLGEFETQVNWEAGGWQQKTLSERLDLIKAKKYASAFLWSAHGGDDKSVWNDKVANEVREWKEKDHPPKKNQGH